MHARKGSAKCKRRLNDETAKKVAASPVGSTVGNPNNRKSNEHKRLLESVTTQQPKVALLLRNDGEALALKPHVLLFIQQDLLAYCP